MSAQGVSVWIERNGGQFIANCGGQTAIDSMQSRAARAAASAYFGVDEKRIDLEPLSVRCLRAWVKPERAATDFIVWLIVGTGAAGVVAILLLWKFGGAR